MSERTVVLANCDEVKDGRMHASMFCVGDPFISMHLIADIIDNVSGRADVSFEEALETIRNIHYETMRDTMDDIIRVTKERGRKI